MQGKESGFMWLLKQKLINWLHISAPKLIWLYRRATCSKRVLPDVIIVGAMKCGTSSLSAYLAQHPQLLRSLVKEVHFFDGGLDSAVDTFKEGHSRYRAYFPLKKNMTAHSKAFEASPSYLFNPLVPKRIFDCLPDTKIIVISRNPTDRAISHYFHEKRKGREKLPIMEAFKEEDKRLKSVLETKDYKSNAFLHYSYKSRGLYKQQIDRYLKYFPKKQILILNSDELFCETNKTLRKVFEFVDVDLKFEVKDLKARHVSKNKSDVDPEVYAYLNSFFLPHNQAFYELIGESYGW